MTLDKKLQVRGDNVKSLKNVAVLLLGMCLLMATPQLPAADEAATSPRALNNQIQDLKQQVLELNRDLFLLEEDLLFPANTQFSVFLSMDAGQLFELDSVQLKIDDKVVANHLYTEREIQALRRGGVQRLYIGNLASGKHELVAFFSGQGPSQRDYRRGTTVNIEKTTDPQYVELKITDNAIKEQPEFNVKVWE